VVEEELGRQYGLLVPVDLDVHVHRAARIPAGVDAGELGDPVRVGDLRLAQVGRIAGGDGFGVADAVRAVGFGGGALGCAVRRTGTEPFPEAGVHAHRVALPDLDHRVLHCARRGVVGGALGGV